LCTTGPAGIAIDICAANPRRAPQARPTADTC
jgi:hypothetical protein